MEQQGGGETGLSKEEIRGYARQLVQDAGDFDEAMSSIREGFKDAADDEPWFSAGGWGMFKQPAAAASEVNAFVREVLDEVEDLGQTLDAMVKEMAGTDTNSGENLDKLGKLVIGDD